MSCTNNHSNKKESEHELNLFFKKKYFKTILTSHVGSEVIYKFFNRVHQAIDCLNNQQKGKNVKWNNEIAQFIGKKS